MSDPERSRVLVAVRVAASPGRTFEAFTAEIGTWWRPNRLFPFTPGKVGTLVFEPGPDGRLVERYDDGTAFTVGRIRRWDPPHRLAFDWRQAGFTDDQTTEVQVRFDAVGDGATRVTVEHFGWNTIPPSHAARHGFPLAPFQQRHAEWWRGLLDGLAATVQAAR